MTSQNLPTSTGDQCVRTVVGIRQRTGPPVPSQSSCNLFFSFVGFNYSSALSVISRDEQPFILAYVRIIRKIQHLI